MDSLLVNAILFVFTWIFFALKKRRICVFMLLMTVYTINAICAYYTVIQGYYFDPDPKLGEDISMIPLVMHYIATLLLCWPFYYFDERKINFRSFADNKLVRLIVIVCLIIVSLYSMLKLSEVLIVRTMDLGEIYQDNHDGEAPLFTYDNPILRLVNSIGGKVNTILKNFLITYFVAKLAQGKSHWLVSTGGLILSVTPSILASMAGANRGGLFFAAFNIIFFYVVIHPSLPAKLKMKLFTIGGLVGVFIILPYVVSITESRFEKSNEGTEGSVYRYFGESLVNWSSQNFKHVKQHTYGAWTFPEWGPKKKSMESAAGFYEYYSKVTGIHTALFGTIYGDAYMEFGYIGGYIFLWIIMYIYRRYVFKYKKEVAFLPMIATYYYLVLCGIFGISYRELDSRIYLLLLYWLCYYVYKKYKRSLRQSYISTLQLENK